MKNKLILFIVMILFFACKKDNTSTHAPSFTFVSAIIDSVTYKNNTLSNISLEPVIKLSFSAPVDTATVQANIVLAGATGIISLQHSFSNNDSSVIVQLLSPLNPLTNYRLSVYSNLKSTTDSSIKNNVYITFITAIDSSDKFPHISDSALLTLIQQQTFQYFWNNANPVSGMARERNSDGLTDATGGTGFGVMAALVGVQRNFISRSDALTRLTTLVNFLSDTTKVKRYHGAFSHWINGATGATIPFGFQDNGGDIVETSYMIEGLLCARQYFNSTIDANEINLRNTINAIYDSVDWNWYRQNQNVLYWNWSPNYGFIINAQVRGWSEALITYVLAASSPTNKIDNAVYTQGWTQNGGMKNGRNYYGYTLPLGSDKGGPLFFEHYSFMGIDPHSLSDTYADYDSQTVNHSLINYSYCVANPHGYYGYSSQCWGLTASDIQTGYNANEPDNDVGVIAPTAAISSLPYSPAESMNAIRFFYYKLGDKLWGTYGFRDAFDLSTAWFDTDYLAIDQGPEVVMIENYRTGMMWNLFMSCPEIKAGMKNLGFSSPLLN